MINVKRSYLTSLNWAIPTMQLAEYYSEIILIKVKYTQFYQDNCQIQQGNSAKLLEKI